MAGSNPNKKQVFYIHGGEAFSKYENFLNHLKTKQIRNLPWSEEPLVRGYWSKHLAEDLGDEFEVFAPAMPNKQNAKYEEWKIWFEKHFEFLRDSLTLVGWSQGGYFLSKYLIENNTPFIIKNLFLLASPFEPEDFGGEDGGDFAFDTSKVATLAKKAEKVFIFHSQDDPIVPYRHFEMFKAGVPQAELVTFEDKNHFLIEEFPELISKIKGLA